jgi:hypothetical protein
MKEQINYKNEQGNKLFDIAACKCFTVCRCHRTFKVPDLKRTFSSDQRTSRKIVIGGIDVAWTKKLKKRQERKAKKRSFSEAFNQPSTSYIIESSDSSSSTETRKEGNKKRDEAGGDPDFSWKYSFEEAKAITNWYANEEIPPNISKSEGENRRDWKKSCSNCYCSS